MGFIILDPRALFPSDWAQSVCESKKPWERGWEFIFC